MIKKTLKRFFESNGGSDLKSWALHELLACASACILLVLLVSYKKMISFHLHTSWFCITLFASTVMALTFVFRNRLSFTFKEIIFFLLLYILAFNGMFNIGIAAPALLLFGFIPLFVLLLHSRKIAFIHLGFSMVFLVLAGYLYSLGVITPSTDLNHYNLSLVSWVSLSSITGIMVTLFLMEYRPVEKAIDSREERIRSIFERSPVAIGLGRADSGLLVEVNDAWLQLFGFQKHEVIGKSADELELYVNRDERAEFIRQISEHGHIVNHEIMMRRKTGELLYVLYSAELINQAEESLLQVMMSDITERKLSEEILRKSEEKFAKAFIAFPELVTISSMTDGRQIDVNDNFLTVTGYNRDEVIGHTSTELGFWINPGDRQIFIDALEKNGYLRNYEIKYRMRNGEVRDFLMSTEILIIAGERCGLSFLIDITQKKRVDEEKSNLESQLQQAQKIESVGRLAGGVAHDFNNMLGVIMGHAELGLKRIDPGHPVCANLQEINKTAERSADLTRQLLAFARKQAVSPKVLNINDAVSGMLKMLQRLIGEDITLVWLPGFDLWSVKIDSSQLDQILANLCVNARDSITDIGLLSIETKNATIDEQYCVAHSDVIPGEYVCLSVCDTGQGMDKETLAHIFEPFFTTKEVGKGTGLGLAMIYGAVKQNRGFINVASEPTKGTTFTIYFPKHVDITVPEDKETITSQIRHGQETILLVEDEPNILYIISQQLILQGYNILSAGSPNKAIALAGKYKGEIHLLMTDVIMPEMNGHDLSRNIQSIHPNIKLLFMSGYTADIISNHGVLEEGVHFIQKPFNMNALATYLRELLDGG